MTPRLSETLPAASDCCFAYRSELAHAVLI